MIVYYILLAVGIISILAAVAISTVVTFTYYRFSPKTTKRLRNIALALMVFGGIVELIAACLD